MVFRAWRASLAVRCAPKTAALWRYCVTRSLADLPRPPDQISSVELARYFEGLTPASAAQTRSALEDFFSFLQGRGYRPDNPLIVIPRQRGPKHRIKRGLDDDELVRLLVALVWLPPRRPWQGHHIAQLALGQALTGLRPSELLDLETDRISLNGRASHLEIINTKTGHDRVVPLSDAARRTFAVLSEGREGRITHYTISRYRELISRAGQVIGLPKAKTRPYALRHTAAGLMVERGVHVRVIAEILGHRDLRATLGYTTPSDSLLVDAVERLANTRNGHSNGHHPNEREPQ